MTVANPPLPARPGWGQLSAAHQRKLNRLFGFWLPLMLFIVVTLFPFYWMVVTSIKIDRIGSELYDPNAFPFWVTQPTIDNYVQLFTRTLYGQWMVNTLFVSAAATAVSLLIAIPAGYALARLRFRAAALLGLAIFITYLVPQTLLFIPLFDVIKSIRVENSYWALILTYPTFLIPFCTWLLMGYFKSIPKELEESALIDGASRIQAMIQIVLPLALPGVLSAGIFAFTLSWNEYIYSLVFMTSANMKTIPVGVVNELIRGDQFYWGQLMAGALLGSVPVAVIYSFFVQHYVAGHTAGAVKG